MSHPLWITSIARALPLTSLHMTLRAISPALSSPPSFVFYATSHTWRLLLGVISKPNPKACFFPAFPLHWVASPKLPKPRAWGLSLTLALYSLSPTATPQILATPFLAPILSLRTILPPLHCPFPVGQNPSLSVSIFTPQWTALHTAVTQSFEKSKTEFVSFWMHWILWTYNKIQTPYHALHHPWWQSPWWHT